MHTILKDGSLLTEGRELLTPPLMTPSGDIRQEFLFNASAFSTWLGLRLEELIKSFPDWKATQPILLGSWARNEICLKSDMDVLFCGDEEKTKELVGVLNERGYKLRYRMPFDPQDWTLQVEAFDILALLKARPLTTEGARKLIEQQKKILLKRKQYGKILLRAISQERKVRAQRFDSITNFLEPNIKYGPGGLRDLEQGLQVYELFGDQISNPSHTLDVLKYYKSYLLTIRHKLHLEGLGDVLVNTAQFDIARWMGFKNQKDFMRDLQSGLSRVNFYTDWLIEAAAGKKADLEKIETLNFRRAEDLLVALHKNPRTLMQKRVREKLNDFFPTKAPKTMAARRGKMLELALSPKTSDDFVVSVFRSRLIDKLLPEIKRLVGYVQHDQYHRFTADTHIMQACREMKRIYHRSRELSSLASFHKKLTDDDWRVLQWACLYHDLAKGLDGPHHSEAGIEIVKRDFKAFGFSKKFTEDVAWLVQNHLELSQAAFRKNPKALSTWQDLRQKDVTGIRLYRLAIFTVIDIRATNPEAWNNWKSNLLRDLVLNLESTSAQNYFEFNRERQRRKLNVSAEIYEELDSLLIEALSASILVQDLKKASETQVDLAPLVIKNKKGEIWIRFSKKTDRAGLLADYVTQLYSLGLGVRHAAIQTFSWGVYDWFQVVTTKKTALIEKLLRSAALESRSLPSVKFTHIELTSRDEFEWVLSFKGIDQAGLLATAAQALAQRGISIRSAQVHTWGRQIEDVFMVKPEGEVAQLMESLQKSLVGPS